MNTINIKTVFPGDPVPPKTLSSFNGKSLLYGDLIKVGSNYFICSKAKRYLPNIDDVVIGKISHKTVDFYRVDLGYGISGFLPSESFYLATKRNKPDLKVGEFVMAKVLRIKDFPILKCEERMGKIDGYVFDVGCYNVKKMIVEKILDVVGSEYNFKLGLGVNGIVFVANENMLIVRSVIDRLREILDINHHVTVNFK